MKFLKQLSFLALLAMLSLTACQKEEIVDTTVEIPAVEPNKEYVNGLFSRSNPNVDGLDLGCVSIDYPFEMVLLDESTIEITSEDDFENAFINPDNPPLDFVYPLNVTDEDDNSLTANDVDELAEFFVDCIPNTGWGNDWPEWFFPAWDITFANSCYQLVYPLDLLDVDSNSVTANDEAELISLLSDGNIYSFAFPLDLEDEDGAVVTAENPDDLFDLLSDCGPAPGNGGYGIGTFVCYELGYPATLLNIDGSTTIVNDDDEFAEALMTGEYVGFEFPVTLIDEDGNETVVNSEEELHEAILDCDPTWGGGGPGTGTGGGGVIVEIIFGCYELGYPATLTLVDGSTVEVNNEEELDSIILTGEWAGFGFPLTLIDEDGNEVVVNDDEEMFEAISECDGIGSGGGTGGGPIFQTGEFFCYDFVYPFSVTEIMTGNEVTFNNSVEWEAYINGNPNGQAIDIVYPFGLIDEDGNEITVDDEEGLIEAIEDCW